jgi:hypothetical protein
MPRIRTLKPEHKQHRKVGMLTDRQYRLWIGMVTAADAHGRLVADAAQLRVLVFPYQPRTTVAHVAEALQHLESIGLIRLYRVGDTPYAEFPSWSDHQKVQHPAASKLPSYQHTNGSHEPSRALMSFIGGSEGIKDQGSDQGSRNGSLHGEGVQNPDPLALAAFSEADRKFLESLPDPYRVQWLGSPDWWLSLGDGYPGVNLQREASKYMAYQDSQSAGQKHRNVRKGFRAWVAKAARWLEQDAMRKAVRR